MKIALFRYVAERVTTLHEFTMIAAVPDGALLQRISEDDYLKKLPSRRASQKGSAGGFIVSRQFSCPR